jgi:hypothetical protein
MIKTEYWKKRGKRGKLWKRDRNEWPREEREWREMGTEFVPKQIQGISKLEHTQGPHTCKIQR